MPLPKIFELAPWGLIYFCLGGYLKVGLLERGLLNFSGSWSFSS